MQVQKQFSVFMVNKPGVLAQVLGHLAAAKINITAMTMVDSTEHGVMRFVCVDPDKARTVLARLNMPVSETDVLCVTLSNRPGALAEIAEKLAKCHINITYAYCTAGAVGGKTTGVLKIADVNKAIKILADKSDPRNKSMPTIRRAPNSRR
jgi:hypothetical protein